MVNDVPLHPVWPAWWGERQSASSTLGRPCQAKRPAAPAALLGANDARSRGQAVLSAFIETGVVPG